MISLKIFVFTISILSLTTSSNAYSECIDGKIKHIFYNKEIISNENYCFELESDMLFSSDPCADGKICISKNFDPIEFKISEKNFETGSPGFKICEKYNGTPQIIEFWTGKKWQPSSRCIFSDGSFIDTSSLAEKTKFLD